MSPCIIIFSFIITGIIINSGYYKKKFIIVTNITPKNYNCGYYSDINYNRNYYKDFIRR